MGRRRGKNRPRLPTAPIPPAPRLPLPTPPAPAPPLPPPAGTSSVGFAEWLGHSGIILVLFETPSGYALFNFDGVNLFRPKAVETIWANFIDKSKALQVVHLKEFQIFDDKVTAIGSDGVDDKLAEMIMRWLRPGQKLAVGKQEYQRIIGTSLGIHCLFDRAVEELMWGLKNLMKILVPDEKLELTDADRLQMSYGMKLVLDRYDFQVDARMVNSHIINMASALYECDFAVNKHSKFLVYGAEQLEEVSQIDCKDWDPLKLAAALKLVCHPKRDIPTGDSKEFLSPDMKQKLVDDADKYKGKLNMRASYGIYEDIAFAYRLRRKALKLLSSMVKEAKEKSELPLGYLDDNTEY